MGDQIGRKEPCDCCCDDRWSKVVASYWTGHVYEIETQLDKVFDQQDDRDMCANRDEKHIHWRKY